MASPINPVKLGSGISATGADTKSLFNENAFATALKSMICSSTAVESRIPVITPSLLVYIVETDGIADKSELLMVNEAETPAHVPPGNTNAFPRQTLLFERTEPLPDTEALLNENAASTKASKGGAITVYAISTDWLMIANGPPPKSAVKWRPGFAGPPYGHDSNFAGRAWR